MAQLHYFVHSEQTAEVNSSTSNPGRSLAQWAVSFAFISRGEAQDFEQQHGMMEQPEQQQQQGKDVEQVKNIGHQSVRLLSPLMLRATVPFKNT